MTKAQILELWKAAGQSTLDGEHSAEVLGDVLSETGRGENVLNILFWAGCLKEHLVCEAEDLNVLAGSLGTPKGRKILFLTGYDGIRDAWLRAVLAVLLFEDWTEEPWYVDLEIEASYD